jgi:hypothetical protein
MSQGDRKLSSRARARKAADQRTLSPYRHTRLRAAPNKVWRDQLVEASAVDCVLVELAGGHCRPLLAVVEADR